MQHVRWIVESAPDGDSTSRLAAALSLPRPLAALLCQRGFDQPERARDFLRPSLERMSDPYSLAGMADAVNEIVRAVRAGETILVHGDYDVDGQCASAVLTRVLRSAGAKVEAFVPHRLRDGYDFGSAGVLKAQAIGAGLVVTCDCGITAVDAVRRAEAAGIRVVVTDHHLPGPELPPARAVVDPQRPDDRSGLQALCGTGIVFKLVQALVPALGLPATLPLHFLDLVAVATVADVVPLVDENRVFVRHGIKLLRQSRWPGLRALVAAAKLTAADIRAGHIGFILAPRLNAAGRIGDAGDGLRLLLTDSAAEAEAIAERLERLNVERQQLDQGILDQAIKEIEETIDLTRASAIVLGAEGWHPGVVGIVASRVVERYGRPAFLVGFEGEIGKGSGRSISRFDLHHALVACADTLERYGGHRMAAGVTVRRDRFADFRERFGSVAGETLAPDTLGPEQRIDLEISLDLATDELERLCRHLEPCGMGNPGPVFGARRVEFVNRQVVGQGHLKGDLKDARGQVTTIGFQFADRVPWLGPDPVDVAFRLEQNDFRGQRTLQARLVALTPHQPGQPDGA